MKLKFNLLIVLFALTQLVNAQDSLLVYKGGKVLYRQLLSGVDSITFPSTPKLFKGLVARFPFNGNTIDVTGNGNNGVNHGATLTTDRFDNENSAYYFDGGSYINCGSNPILNLTDSFTICVWAKTNVASNNCGVIGRWRNNSWVTPTEQFVLFFTSSTVQACVYPVGWIAGTSYAKTNFNYADNTWHFYSMTYNGLSTKLFVDGVLKSELTQTGKVQNALNDLLIGTYALSVPSSANLNWFGKIDDVWIYNRTLNSLEIKEIYNYK